MKPKIQMSGDTIEGYGGPGYSWVRGVYDNRLLFYVKSSSEADVAVLGERERVKWEKLWPSQAAFLKAVHKKPLASPLCANCKKPTLGQHSSCLNKDWCNRPACRVALEAARRQYQEDMEARGRADVLQREKQVIERIEKVEAAVSGAFHWRDGWFFRRLADGAVRVMRRTRPGTQWLESDTIIPAAEWASIVCSVSAAGETAERWDRAQLFHGNAGGVTK